MKIVVTKQPNGMHRLMVRSLAGESPAGPRLFRATELMPKIEFEHFDAVSAKADAKKLEAHLAANPRRKAK